MIAAMITILAKVMLCGLASMLLSLWLEVPLSRYGTDGKMAILDSVCGAMFICGLSAIMLSASGIALLMVAYIPTSLAI